MKCALDIWDIDAGANFFDKIEQGLAQARYVAVVLSPALMQAPFARMEWQHVLAEDPTNRRRRVLPLLYRAANEQGERISLPPPFRVLNWIDFTDERQFKRRFQRLVRVVRDLPAERGRARRPIAGLGKPAAPLPVATALEAAPDQVHEAILSNLLPVQRFPSTIWSASTTARLNKDVWDVVKDAPPFVLEGKRLYSLVDLSAAPTVFDPCIDRRTILSEPITTWKADNVRLRWLINLFNRTIRRHLGKQGIWWSSEHRVSFFPGWDDAIRVHRNGRDASRKVAAKHQRYGTDLSFWVHHAASLEARLIGDEFYVLVTPTYGVSTDGKRLLKAEWVGDVKRAWGGRERNATILRHVIFWGRTLARGKPSAEIETGGGALVVSAIPALATSNFGLEWDYTQIRALLADDGKDLDEAAAVLGSDHAE